MSGTQSIILPTNPVVDPSAVDEAARLTIEGGGQQPLQQPTPPTDEQAQNIVNEAGLDVEAIESHWLEHQTIPEAELEKLAKVGITKEMAQDYIAYRHSQAQASQNELMAQVGGDETFTAMSAWAAGAWSAEQLAAYNEAIDSGNKGQIQLALKALKAEYAAANPQPKPKPKLVNVPNQQASGVQGYRSLAEAQRDFSNPLYHRDPAFRDQVEKRLAASNIV